MKPHVSQSSEAERAILGAVILSNGEVLDRVSLDPGLFFDPRHRDVAEAARRLHSERKPVDTISLHDALGPRSPGLGFLSELLEGVVTADNAGHYAGIVRHHALTRRVAMAAGEILSCGLEGEELLGKALAVIGRIESHKPDTAKPMRDVVQAVFKRLDAINAGKQQGRKAWGLPMGFGELDELMGGIPPGVVTILAGRPSHGKSSLARSLADNANAEGVGVHVFTMEDSAESYGFRQLADAARMDLQRLRNADIRRGDMDAINFAAGNLNQREGWLVDDSAGLGSAEIAMRVRRHRHRNKTRLVVVDYVQLMREREARRGDKQDEVAKAAEGMQRLARDEGVAVLLLSQLSRESERRDDKRPMLSDLRESGVLEQIADVVMFAFRPDRYLDPDAKPGSKARQEWDDWAGKGMVIVGKNKHGQTGQVVMAFDAPTATYRPMTYRRDA